MNDEDRTSHDAAPGERPEDVYEDLLSMMLGWMEDSRAGLVPDGFFEEQERKWRQRFYAARRREGVIYEGDDD